MLTSKIIKQYNYVLKSENADTEQTADTQYDPEDGIPKTTVKYHMYIISYKLTSPNKRVYNMSTKIYAGSEKEARDIFKHIFPKMVIIGVDEKSL